MQLKDSQEFFSPISLAFGFTFLVNGVVTLIKYIFGSSPITGWDYLTIIIACFIIGLVLIYCGFKLSGGKKDLFIKTCLTFGISILLAGFNIYYFSHLSGQILIFSGVGLLLLGTGSLVFCK